MPEKKNIVPAVSIQTRSTVFRRLFYMRFKQNNVYTRILFLVAIVAVSLSPAQTAHAEPPTGVDDPSDEPSLPDG